MSKIIQLNEDVIKSQFGEMVRGTVEETLNQMLDQEADRLANAARYERNRSQEGHTGGVLPAQIAHQGWRGGTEDAETAASAL